MSVLITFLMMIYIYTFILIIYEFMNLCVGVMHSMFYIYLYL